MRFKRVGIATKLTGIYLIIAVPLLVALAVSGTLRYRERVERLLLEREEVAALTAASFSSEMRSIGVTLNYVGEHVLAHGTPEEQDTEELRSLSEEYPITSAAVSSVDGRIVASTRPDEIGGSLDRWPGLEELLSGDRPFTVSDVMTLRGRPGFHVARALFDNGEVRAIVDAFVELEALQVHLTHPVAEGSTHIVDGAGRLVFSSTDPRLVREGSDWSGSAFVRRALDGERVTGIYRHPATGAPSLIAEVPVRDFGWAAGSSLRSSLALGTLRQQSALLAGSVVAVQVLVFGLVLWLSNRLVSPLADLVEDARVVGRGDFDHPIVAPTGDEIEDLALSMDQQRRRLRRYVEGLTALSETGRSLATATPEGLDRAIIDGASRLFGVAEVWVLVVEGDRLVPRLLFGTDLADERIGSASADSGILADVVRSGVPHIVADVRELPPSEWARRAAAREVRSIAMLPLRSRGFSFGVLGIAAGQVMPWSEESRERELLEVFAGQVADALENVRLFRQVKQLAEDNERLFEHERDVAARLQESLLRMPERIPGIRLRHLYRSASKATLVGGDFYDVFELAGQRLGLALGDVSGKGLEAATLISFLKSSLRAYAYEGYPPARVLGSINEAVARLSGAAEFVTVFFGVLECGTGRLVYCSAGHPEAVVRRSTGERATDLLSTESPLLGAFSGVRFVDSEISLAPHDTLFLYTDGVSEARNAEGQLFGSRRVAETVEEAPIDADLTQVVFRRVMEFSEGRLHDDIAMIAATVMPDEDCEPDSPPQDPHVSS